MKQIYLISLWFGNNCKEINRYMLVEKWKITYKFPFDSKQLTGIRQKNKDGFSFKIMELGNAPKKTLEIMNSP